MDKSSSAAERVADNVRLLRELQGLTLRDVTDRVAHDGHALGVNALSRIERGERRADADDIAALAHVLGVGIPALFVDQQVVLRETVRIRWEEFREAYEHKKAVEREAQERLFGRGEALRQVVQGDPEAQETLRNLLVSEFGETATTVEYMEIFLAKHDDEDE